MNIIGIIPARLASSRLPNKPLAKICGIPMIGHVYYRSKMCNIFKEVYIATCDVEIADYIKSIGGKYVMTSNLHERASDRTAEALLKIEEELGSKMDIVVMIQGDEPMITPEMIKASIEPLYTDSTLDITNVMGNINSIDEFEDPAEVKVVIDCNSNALYFSREPIPSRKKGVSNVPMLKQVCIIPFRRDFLLKYNSIQPTELEIIESIDMNRLLQNNIKIRMIFRSECTYSVDTNADLLKVNKLMDKDKLLEKYNI